MSPQLQRQIAMQEQQGDPRPRRLSGSVNTRPNSGMSGLSSVPGIQALVDAALANPTGSRPMAAEIAAGDLSDPAAKAALTAAAHALLDSIPGPADTPAA
jgi:hypothetical protein